MATATIDASGTASGTPSASPPRAARLGVAIRGVGLAYDGVPLLDGLDLDVAAGATTCLLGPSGVGKSSLLRMIAGIEDTGPGTILGSDGATLAGRVAFMDQRDLLYPWLSVAANVALGARLRGEAVDHGRVRRLLNAVGLAARAGDRPDTLSGGMRQRVALARTLMEDRPVVLMDEPFSALDALTRLRVQELAAALLAGRTVLLVTHDPLEALRLGHRVHVMAGRPARLDRPLEVPGPPPRDAAGPHTLRLAGQLLARLRGADAAGTDG